MWIDGRGSEVLQLPECRRLLALGSKMHIPGHLGIATEGAPLVLPVDYSAHGSDVLVQIGESLFTRVDGRMVAFEVDSYEQGTASEGRWSVLVRGFASEVEDASRERFLPEPRVAEPGHRLVHLRGDVVTGRRLRPPGEAAPGPHVRDS